MAGILGSMAVTAGTAFGIVNKNSLGNFGPKGK